MIIYVIAILAIALLTAAFTIYKPNKIKNLITLILGGGLLFFISAFRLNTGYDYAPYANMYVRYYDYSLEELASLKMEKGYMILNYILQCFTDNFFAIFVVTSFIIILLVGIIIYKYSYNVGVGLLMFVCFGYYFNSMNFIRNVTAAVIFMFALKYAVSKDFFRYLIIVLLASAFHLSALLMIPFYFIFQIRFNSITLGITAAISVVLYIFSIPITSVITKYIYTVYDPMQSKHMMLGIPLIYPILFGVVFVIAFIYRSRLEEKTQWTNILLTSSYYTFYFELLGFKHSIISRFSLYFGMATVMILIPNLFMIMYGDIKKCESRTKRITAYATSLLICAVSITFITYALTHNYNGVVPHDWLWNY